MHRTPISTASSVGPPRLVLLGILAFAGVLRAQSMPEESNRFEVASIRRSTTNSDRPSMEFTPGGGVRVANATMKMLIQMAYDIRSEQVSGGPGWTDSEEYTVVAKGPGGVPALSEAVQLELTRKRLQGLLSERFHLALKLETPSAAGYVLLVDKKGHKMTLAENPEARRLRQIGRWGLSAERVEMSIFARFLSVHLRSTVEDRTGLEGHYNFQLDWNPTVWTPGVPIPSAMSAAASELPEDSLIPAVRDQLGLRLERQKVVTDRYTIEHAEKPTEN